MTSTRTPASKRSSLPRNSSQTKAFQKDWTRLTHSGRYDMHRLKAAMILLITNEAQLGAEWSDHALCGEWAEHRECHAGGDLLLIYQLDDASNMIEFVRAGTHAELFK